MLLSLFAGLFEYMGLILIFQFVLFLTNPTTKHCQNIISFFEIHLNISDFSKISLILGITIALLYVFKNIYMLIFTKINNNILQDLSVKITQKTVYNLLFQDFLITNKITNEEKLNVISKINLIVWQYCYKYINLIINCAIAIILLAYLFIKFTTIALSATLFISILALIEYVYLKKNSTFQNKHFSVCFDELNSLLFKTVTSIKEIKLNNQEEYYLKKIENKCNNYAHLNKNRSFCDIFHIYFTEISVMFAFIIVLTILFYTTNFNNQLLISTIATICVIILRLTPVINRAQSCLYAINSNKSLAIELLEFDDKFEKNFKLISTKEKFPFEKTIELKNINFSYKNNTGLKNINLTINKNDFVGIVGKSGCFKTTLSLIISGLIKPQNGKIYIDEQELNNDNYQKWQNNIALLSQDYSILFENLNEISKEYIDKLNIKNDLKINEMSYGERQRLALANILTKDKEIIILDEITSSSDVINEDKINEVLFKLKGQKTIIAIAHRLNILKHCNKIIYMDNGKIIDIATFKELNERYEEFKKMIELSTFRID